MKVQNQGAEIFFTTVGRGPDVVLLHPFPSCLEFWLPVGLQLSLQYRVTMLDLRAHGQSISGDGPATMALHAADLAEVCREQGIRKAIFVGVSIGGYVLFEFWRSYRDHIQALVLSNTKATADTAEARAGRLATAEKVLQEGPEAFVESMLPRLLGVSSLSRRPDIVESARKTMRFSTANGIAAAQRGMAERADSLLTLRSIRVPVLVTGGTEDALTPEADILQIHQAVPGSRMAMVPEAGHYAALEQPFEYLRTVQPFLESLK